MVRRMIFAVALLMPVTVFAQTPFANLKLACFSPQRAFSESAQGKAALARLSALRDQRDREIQDKNQALQTQEQSLLQSAGVVNDNARAQRSKEIEAFRVNIQRFIQDAQSEVLGLQRDLESAFLAKLKPVVDEVAKQNGLSLVLSLDEGAIVWAAPAVDITGDVVKQLARLDTPDPR